MSHITQQLSSFGEYNKDDDDDIKDDDDGTFSMKSK